MANLLRIASLAALLQYQVSFQDRNLQRSIKVTLNSQQKKNPLKKLVVTGFSRCGKAALLAGLLDERFGVVNPGGSGSGGAAPYRYDSYGNTPYRRAPFGNVYPWGTSPVAEVLGDHVRHQTHNSNEMLARFLNPDRMYKTQTHGYGERLPYDHHEIIAAIAPRAVIIDTTNEDYANNAEAISLVLRERSRFMSSLEHAKTWRSTSA